MRGNRVIPGLGQTSGGIADMVIDPEGLLEHDNRAGRVARRLDLEGWQPIRIAVERDRSGDSAELRGF
jgi:hypothetical protein